MDPNLLIGIVGTILTIIGTIFGYRSFKDQSKTRIYYFRKQFIQLYDDVVKSIPGLAITYNDLEIKKKMFIVKAAFICSGRKDITSSDITKGIILELKGQNARWHSHKISSKSSNLDLKIDDTDPCKLIISPELLKDKDYLVFEGLGESDEANFYIDHRIANVPEVVVNKVGVEKSILTWLIIFSVFSFVSFSLFSKGFNQATQIYTFHGHYFDKKNREIDKFQAIDTVSYNTTSSYEDRKVRIALSDSEVNRRFPKSMNPKIREVLMDIATDRANDSIVEVKSPNKEYVWERNDSILKVADSQYSKSRMNLLFEGKTKMYRLSPNYFVQYRLETKISDVIISLIIPLLGGLIFLILTFRNLIKYFHYREIASLASRLLN